jgi:SAM-dependent methyltransferase
LARSGGGDPLVVDLGCGSGILARELTEKGFDVVGIDASAAMLELARQVAPRATFVTGSFLDAEIPACSAVAAIGECFSYVFDARVDRRRLAALFRRVHTALRPNGILLFDVAIPGQMQSRGRRTYSEGDGWVVLIDRQEDRRRRILVRRLTVFREREGCWHRSQENHNLRLYDADQVSADLRAAGFTVRRLKAYRDLPFPSGVAGFLARKTG